MSGSMQGVDSLEPCLASWASDKRNHVGIYLILMEPVDRYSTDGLFKIAEE